MKKQLNIISFDVPWPADYGGVIDVFYKIKELKKAGVGVILHCFEYGRKQQRELEKYCEEVYYYKRKKNVLQLFSDLPFIVKSRISEDLEKNLLQNNYPVLFEALHTCFLLNHPQLRNRKKIFRESNIEHEYYRHLANAEKNKLKRSYYLSEARKLEKFEAILKHADLMLVVSETETSYFRNKFHSVRTEFLPSFHGNEDVGIKAGAGKFILYHGKLSVPENAAAASWLVDQVFSRVKFPVVIAGKDPGKELERLCDKHEHIQLIANPSEKKMKELLQNAHVHCLYTAQPTGLKLKLLNVLYNGRFTIVNKHMIEGTSLNKGCIVAATPAQWIKEINWCFERNFDAAEIENRKKILEPYNNSGKIKKLIRFIWTQP